MTIRALLPLTLLLAGGCAGLRGQTTICPEYRDLRCMTAHECSMDQARGCQVCQCQPIDSENSPQSGIPPDRRYP